MKAFAVLAIFLLLALMVVARPGKIQEEDDDMQQNYEMREFMYTYTSLKSKQYYW